MRPVRVAVAVTVADPVVVHVGWLVHHRGFRMGCIQMCEPCLAALLGPSACRPGSGNRSTKSRAVALCTVKEEPVEQISRLKIQSKWYSSGAAISPSRLISGRTCAIALPTAQIDD
jgi:hypothetical protein